MTRLFYVQLNGSHIFYSFLLCSILCQCFLSLGHKLLFYFCKENVNRKSLIRGSRSPVGCVVLRADLRLLSVCWDTWQQQLCGETRHPLTDVCVCVCIRRKDGGGVFPYFIPLGWIGCFEMRLPCSHISDTAYVNCVCTSMYTSDSVVTAAVPGGSDRLFLFSTVSFTSQCPNDSNCPQIETQFITMVLLWDILCSIFL